MSTAAPTKAPPPPIAPPDEEFWHKYSPHYEFPLSSIGSFALHIAALAVCLLLLWLVSRLVISDRTPVPMTAMIVAGDGDRNEGAGSGGPANEENVDPLTPPREQRVIPPAEMERINEIKEWTPTVPSADEGTRPEDLKVPNQLAKLTDDLRKAIIDGMKGKKGRGPNEGSGNTGVAGKGSGTAGDPSSSANRAVRWELIFKTANGKDYLAQLAAMKATLVIQNPPDWKTSKLYRDLSSPNGEAFNIDQLPGLYFIDDEADSASKLARALGLSFDPPRVLAFFPKDIEEELASKERAYRGRKEGEIFSTKFKILIRDGKPSITVVDQIPVTGRGR